MNGASWVLWYFLVMTAPDGTTLITQYTAEPMAAYPSFEQCVGVAQEFMVRFRSEHPRPPEIPVTATVTSQRASCFPAGVEPQTPRQRYTWSSR